MTDTPPMSSARPRLLKVSEVATELRITRHAVYRLIDRGHLPAVRLSQNGTRVASDALDALIASGGVANDPD